MMIPIPDLIRRGNEAFARGDNRAALAFYQEALAVSRGDPDHLADLYGNLGNVYGTIGESASARVHYHKAIDILREKEDYVRLGVTFTNLGNLEVDQNNSDEAIHWYKQAALLLEREGRDAECATLYCNIALALRQKADLPAARSYAERALRLAETCRDLRLIAAAALRLSTVQRAAGEIDAALRQAEAAYTLYAQSSDEMGIAATLYHQAALYEARHDPDAACRCMEQVVQIDEKYHLPKLAENRARLSRLRAACRTDREKPAQ